MPRETVSKNMNRLTLSRQFLRYFDTEYKCLFLKWFYDKKIFGPLWNNALWNHAFEAKKNLRWIFMWYTVLSSQRTSCTQYLNTFALPLNSKDSLMYTFTNMCLRITRVAYYNYKFFGFISWYSVSINLRWGLSPA